MEKTNWFSMGIYKLGRVRVERFYWICQIPHCKGRVVKQENEIQIYKDHNHCPESASAEVSSLLSTSVREVFIDYAYPPGIINVGEC